MRIKSHLNPCFCDKVDIVSVLSKLFILVLKLSVLIHSVDGFTKTVVLEGNVSIAGLFELRSPRTGVVDVPSVITLEAVRWYLQAVNAKGVLPFTIGLEAFETNGMVGLAGDSAVDIIYRSRVIKTANNTKDFTIGVLGPARSSEAQVVSSIIGSQSVYEHLLQVAYSATSPELDDRGKYPSFYRVCPEDGVQINTIVQLMLRLQWNRIAIMYTEDTYGQEAAALLRSQALDHHICVSKMNGIQTDPQRLVDSGKIRAILLEYIITAPRIQGVVFLGGKLIANTMFETLEHLPYSNIPVFILSESHQRQTDVFYSASSNVFQKAKGTLAMSFPYREDTEFAEYWRSLFTNLTSFRTAAVGNPYLNDVFKHYSGCDIATSTTCEALSDEEIMTLFTPQPVYVSYAIMAVNTIVEALRKVYDMACRETRCESLDDFRQHFKPYQLVHAMDGLQVSRYDVTLRFSKDSPNPALSTGDNQYEVYNFISNQNKTGTFTLVKIGQMSSGNVVIDTTLMRDYSPADGTEKMYPDVRRGQCPVGDICEECLHQDVTSISYYIPGDFYVVGIISINDRAIPGPLGCGRVRVRHGYQMYLALEFGLHEFETRTWYHDFREDFAGKSVGMIVLNSCNNPLEIVPKVLDMHANGLLLPNGTRINITDRILGYVGGQAAEVSEPVAAQLTELKFVQVSYTTTRSSLSNKQLYPFFLRIITPDSVQAKAIIDIVKKLNGKYVQLVYSEGGYGEGGRDGLRREAAIANICIAQETAVFESDSYFRYYEILKRKPHAKIVIVFLRSHFVEPFLRDLNNDMTRGEFQFIGSEAWGRNTDVLKYDISKGSLIVTAEMDKNMEMEEYIKSKKPDFNVSDPWLEDYIQNRYNCYYSWSYNKKFDIKCTDSMLPNNDPGFESDPWCIFVFNSMIALLKGASRYYAAKCGRSSDTELCASFVDNPLGLIQELKLVKMNVYGTGDMLIFDSKGDGLMGYTIYNIKDKSEDRSSRIYAAVGSYRPSRGLDLELSAIEYPTDETIVSACPSESACANCMEAVPTTAQSQGRNVAIPVLGTFLGVLCVVITLLVVVVVMLKRKANINHDTLYLTPTANTSETVTPEVMRRPRSEGDGYIDPSTD